MIHRPPYANCAGCDYTLNPPKTEGRCPECGMSIDAISLVFRPTPQIRRVVVWVLTLIGIGYLAQMVSLWCCAMVVGPLFAIGGFAVIFILAVVYVVRTAIPTKNRRPTVILMHDAMVVLRDGHTERIAFDQIKRVDRYNFYPEVALEGSRQLRLIGVFDSHKEWLTFAELVKRFKSGNFEEISETISRFRLPTKPRIWSVDRWASRGKKLTTAQRQARILTSVGVVLMGLSYFASTSLAILSTANSRVWAMITSLLFFCGVAIALIGQWRSDPRKSDQNDDDGPGS